MNECRRVHAHKREQRAKIQQLGSLLVRNQKSPDERYRAACVILRRDGVPRAMATLDLTRGPDGDAETT